MSRHRNPEKVCKWYFQYGDRITPCVSADAWATVESPSGRQPSMVPYPGAAVSRSIKKVWAGPNCVCRSCKQDKRIAHGIYRSNVHRLLRVEGDNFMERNEHEFKHGSDWSWESDGHNYAGSLADLMRFVVDVREYHQELAK